MTQTLTLEELAYITYFAGTEDPYSDEGFVHMFRFKNSWTALSIVLSELQYIDGNFDECYLCSTQEDILCEYISKFCLAIEYMPRHYTYYQLFRILRVYVQVKIRHPSSLCLECVLRNTHLETSTN